MTCTSSRPKVFLGKLFFLEDACKGLIVFKNSSSKLTFTFSKATIETLEKGVKYDQSQQVIYFFC